MKRQLVLFLTVFALGTVMRPAVAQTQAPKGNYVMVIHGGAGTILKKNMTPEKEKAYKEKLTEALQTGYNLLKAGKISLDAVEATVRVMEVHPCSMRERVLFLPMRAVTSSMQPLWMARHWLPVLWPG
jgi:beta-aspartyl-peptidase (threonine type)